MQIFKKISREGIKNFLLASIPFLTIIIIWEILFFFEVIPHYILPSPFKVLISFYNLIKDGVIFSLVSASLLNSIGGFLSASIASILLGLYIGLSKTGEKIFSPILALVYPIPSLAWIPLIIMFFGFSRLTILVVVFIACFFRMIFNVISGVKGVNRNYIWIAKNFQINRFNFITKIILPGAFPHILTGMRLGFGASWRALVGAEIISVGVKGLGAFIWQSQWFYRFDQVVVGMIIIGLIGYLVEEFFFKKIEKITVRRWGLVREG